MPKVVKTRARLGFLLASPITLPAISSSWPMSELWRLCTCILKPPPLPRPRTGGGGIAMMRASWMGAVCLRTSPRMAGAVRPLATRSSNGFRVRNITAPLVVLVKVDPSKPEMITALATPATCSARRAASRTTAVVRSSEAPEGSCTTVIR